MMMLSQVADGKNISTPEEGRSERGGQGRGKGDGMVRRVGGCGHGEGG